MGMSVVLQDEKCGHISPIITDSSSVILQSLPNESDGSYVLIQFVDPYGDTVFNRLQARALIGEWDRLRPSFVKRNAEELWVEVRKLIVQCSEEPHTYLRFIGD